MAATDARWVLAVDVRGTEHRTAVARAGGVRVAEAPAGEETPPLAVVVVHPAGWPQGRIENALAEVAQSGPAWPAPVPLTTPEAAAWRALEFGLVPARGRLVVLDPLVGEAAVVDREGDSLQVEGGAVSLPPGATADAEQLVALARRALDEAPAGPPFAGVLLAGPMPGAADDAALPGLIAKVTGRAPLVPGDAEQAALLGAAALGWAAATSSDEPTCDPAQGRARSRISPDPAPAYEPAPGGPRLKRRPAGELPGPATSGPSRPRTGRRIWLAGLLAVLVVIAVMAGLGWHRARTAPSPYTVTCPDGQVVAYSFECPTLAPSSSP